MTTPISHGDVRRVSRDLRAYAEHYVQDDWDYTRDKGRLVHLRYRDDFSGYDRPDRRLLRALGALVPALRRRTALDEMFAEVLPRKHPLRTRLRLARSHLRTPRHLPDGVLDDGGVITVREETGEYLQFVQPSVGSKIADLLDADDADLPAARDAIAAEMLRIQKRYTERIAAGEVTRFQPPSRRSRPRRSRRRIR